VVHLNVRRLSAHHFLMNNQLKRAILLVISCIGAVLFFTSRRPDIKSLSLTFQRYSDLAPTQDFLSFETCRTRPRHANLSRRPRPARREVPPKTGIGRF